MTRITKLTELVNFIGQQISFDAVVTQVLNEGDVNRKSPMKFRVMIEDSGDIDIVNSWQYHDLDVIKRLVETDEVYTFSGNVVQSKTNGKPEIRVSSMKATGARSTRKTIKDEIDISEIKDEIMLYVKTYIAEEHPFYHLIMKFVINNDDFWRWPAAKSVHHAYTGGLAKHSLGVLKNAISNTKTYPGKADIPLIVAGAILHDIGKLDEYDQHGNFTIRGNLCPHIISGTYRIRDEVVRCGWNPDDEIFAMLFHIILSHHGKLEYGSPVVPMTYEAHMIHMADSNDAYFTTLVEGIERTPSGCSSGPLLGLNRAPVINWKGQ